jgi:hypothetical protein
LTDQPQIIEDFTEDHDDDDNYDFHEEEDHNIAIVPAFPPTTKSLPATFTKTTSTIPVEGEDITVAMSAMSLEQYIASAMKGVIQEMKTDIQDLQTDYDAKMAAMLSTMQSESDAKMAAMQSESDEKMSTMRATMATMQSESDAKMAKMRKYHDADMAKMQAQFDVKLAKRDESITSLKKDVARLNESSFRWNTKYVEATGKAINKKQENEAYKRQTKRNAIYFQVLADYVRPSISEEGAG